MNTKDLDPDTLRWAADYMKQNASVVLMFAHGRATDVWVYLLNLKASDLDRSTPAQQDSRATAPNSGASLCSGVVPSRGDSGHLKVEPKSWIAEGLAEALRESTPEQRQRVADHPSGFIAPSEPPGNTGHPPCGSMSAALCVHGNLARRCRGNR